MKKLLIILLCIMVMACNQELEKEMPITEPVASELPIKRTEPQLESITFKNVLKLKTKQYRVRPWEIQRGWIGGNQWVEDKDAIIRKIYFGNVNREGNIINTDEFPRHTAKINVVIEFKRLPYKYTKAGEHAFETDGDFDELAILIDSKSKIVSTVIGGGKGNLFRYKLVSYKGSLIKNLSKPEILLDFNAF